MLVKNKANKKIGFMLGRFSQPIDNRIQAFPWESWRKEFMQANKHGFAIMEWVIEQERLSENPAMSENGRKEIKKLMKDSGVRIFSVTCDTFIEEPFYKAEGIRAEQLLADFKETVAACSAIGISKIVVPLVDKGSLEDQNQEMKLLQGLDLVTPLLIEKKLAIAFESDFDPEKLKSFIDKFDLNCFGINYDIGNSASLGYDFNKEIAAYGQRIINVHVKDRALGGSTVPLGEGYADFPGVLRALNKCGYSGNYILQTARDREDNHGALLCKYRDLIAHWLE